MVLGRGNEDDTGGEVDGGSIASLAKRAYTSLHGSPYPSIFTKQPRGTTKSVTVCGTPCALTTLRDIGSVAADEAEPQAVIQAGAHLNQ